MISARPPAAAKNIGHGQSRPGPGRRQRAFRRGLPLAVPAVALVSALVLGIMGCVPTSWGDSGGRRGAIDAVSAGSPPPRGGDSLIYYYFIKSNYHEIDQNEPAALMNMKKASDLNPASAYLKMEAARLFARNGDNDTALIYAASAIRLDPAAPEPRDFAAWLYGSTGRWDAAINEYKEILRLHPDNSKALTHLGALYAETGRLEEAEDIFKKLRAANPEAASSHYYLGSFYRKTGRPKEALAAFNAAVKKDPDFTDALTEMAALYEEQKDLKSAENTYRRIIKTQPYLTVPRARLAGLLIKSGRAQEAESILNEINSEARTGPAQFRLGLLYLEQGLYKDAAEAFEGALKSAPKNEQLLYLLATTQLELDEVDKAKDNLAKIPKTGEQYADARLILATLAGDAKESLKIVTAAIKAKPAEPRLRLAQAMLQDELGETDKARKTMQGAAKKFPDLAEVFFRLGVFEDKLGNKPATIEAMRRAVELDPRHADALNYLAYTWAERGENLEEALVMAEKADRLKPGSGYIIDTLGWIYYHLGDMKKAHELLAKAVPLSGDDPVVLDHLGDVLVKLGRPKEALKTYRQALEKDINNQQELREELHEKIRRLSP